MVGKVFCRGLFLSCRIKPDGGDRIYFVMQFWGNLDFVDVAFRNHHIIVVLILFREVVQYAADHQRGL
jgi:hypothetical protein